VSADAAAPPADKPRKAPKADPPPTDDGFATFWDAYPNHQNRAKALKAWKALHPSSALQDIILAAIADQQTWRQWREGFIPHPTTWLHGKRWDDERPADDRPSRPVVTGPPVAVSTETWAEARQRQLAALRGASGPSSARSVTAPAGRLPRMWCRRGIGRGG
jgi:hypothetical protein